MFLDIGDVPDLSPIESEFASSEEADAYDLWFRAKIEAALAGDRPKIPHDEAMAKARKLMKGRRNAASGLGS